MRASRLTTLVLAFAGAGVSLAQQPPAGDAALGTIPYERFERPSVCATCHIDISRQHEQAMMAQAYIHPWARGRGSGRGPRAR